MKKAMRNSERVHWHKVFALLFIKASCASSQWMKDFLSIQTKTFGFCASILQRYKGSFVRLMWVVDAAYCLNCVWEKQPDGVTSEGSKNRSCQHEQWMSGGGDVEEEQKGRSSPAEMCLSWVRTSPQPLQNACARRLPGNNPRYHWVPHLSGWIHQPARTSLSEVIGSLARRLLLFYVYYMDGYPPMWK